MCRRIDVHAYHYKGIRHNTGIMNIFLNPVCGNDYGRYLKLEQVIFLYIGGCHLFYGLKHISSYKVKPFSVASKNKWW